MDRVLNYSGNRPAGITSTNATIATDGPPTWDASLSISSNWFKFQASGFHFSSPTIKMKLSTTAASDSTLTSTNANSLKIPVAKKLVCKKGKSTKTKLIQSKCPAGYTLQK